MKEYIETARGGKMVIRQAPEKTPEKLRPYMRIVETLKQNYKGEVKYKDILKEAKIIYDKLKE